MLPYRGMRGVIAVGSLALVGGFGAAACSQNWDALDPRLGQSTGGTEPVGGSPGGPGGSGATSNGGQGGDGSGGTPDAGGTGQGGSVVASCGNGVIESPVEECDDGDVVDADGCSATCTVECAGFVDGDTFHCYELHPGLSSWVEARDACLARGRGFYLVTFGSQAELDFVFSDPGVIASLGEAPDGNIWIGGTDGSQEGTWVWVNGEPWTFEAWTRGQPDDYLMAEDCVELWPYDTGFGWNDQSCDDGRAYLCERPPAGR